MKSKGTQRALLAVAALVLSAGVGVAYWFTGADSPSPSVPQGAGHPGTADEGESAAKALVSVDRPERVVQPVHAPAAPRDRAPSSDGGLGPEAARREAPPSGDATSGIELTVTDSAGRPIHGARVEASLGEWKTDVAGMALIPLPRGKAGTMHLQVWGPTDPTDEGLGYWPTEALIEHEVDQDLLRHRTVLYRPGRISGTLSCVDGTSPRSANLDLCHLATRSWSQASADENGVFTSDWMALGEVVLYARNGEWSDDDLKTRDVLEVVEGQTSAYHGSLGSAIQLRGRVVGSGGRPLGEEALEFYDARNPEYSDSLYTEADGTFRIEGLYPGDLRIVLPHAKAGARDTIVHLRPGQTNVAMGDLVLRRKGD